MRAKEFINEGKVGSLQDDVADALPATYVIPQLANQDPYKQYRFGLALAAAKSHNARTTERAAPFNTSSAWGENMVVVGYEDDIGGVIDDALQKIGMSSKDKKLISTPTSEEAKDVVKGSPVPTKKKNKYGV